jgi:uncharacterized protein (TIGR03067 family)
MTALLLAIPLVAAAPVPKELKKEKPALDGAWKLTGITFNGQQLGGNQTAVWTFEGNTLTINNNNGGVVSTRPIRVDPQATPMEFEFDARGNQLGIYEIKDDVLTICLGQQAGVRPKEVSEQNAIVYRFARAKDAGKKGK